jgi:pantoate--beta-alanine ligase
MSETDPAFSLDYLALVNPETFASATAAFEGEALLIVAARVGSTRLIDNVPVTLTGPGGTGSLVSAGSAGSPEYAPSSGVASPPSAGG